MGAKAPVEFRRPFCFIPFYSILTTCVRPPITLGLAIYRRHHQPDRKTQNPLTLHMRGSLEMQDQLHLIVIELENARANSEKNIKNRKGFLRQRERLPGMKLVAKKLNFWLKLASA
ncbi:hypothetical protein M8J75_016502 [Diaphorina citri]|nr:hypothetical protein M8J75_016502 [Diaphorina citri]